MMASFQLHFGRTSWSLLAVIVGWIWDHCRIGFDVNQAHFCNTVFVALNRPNLFIKNFFNLCNTSEALAKSISDAEAKVGQVTSDIEEAESQVVQLKGDLKQHQSDRAAAKAAMADATAIRKPSLKAWGIAVRPCACDVTSVICALRERIISLRSRFFYQRFCSV